MLFQSVTLSIMTIAETIEISTTIEITDFFVSKMRPVISVIFQNILTIVI